MLGEESIGIRLQKNIPMGAADLEFVMLSLGNSGNENLPDTGSPKTPHHVAATIPSIEIPDDADPLRIGGPDGEGSSIDAIYYSRMSSKDFVGLQMFSLPKQIEVQLPERRGKRIRIARTK